MVNEMREMRQALARPIRRNRQWKRVAPIFQGWVLTIGACLLGYGAIRVVVWAVGA